MRVRDGVHVGPSAIHFGMDVELERRLRAALNQIAIEIDGDDVVHRQRTPHRCPGIDVEGVAVAAGAAMTAVVDDLGAFQHPDRIDERLFHRVTRP